LHVQPFPARCESFGAAAAELGVNVRTIGPATLPTFEEARGLMRQTLARGAGRTTAVFAHNDFMAMGAVRALRGAGEGGRRAGTLALDAIGGSLDPDSGAQTPATLVVRSSTAAPRPAHRR